MKKAAAYSRVDDDNEDYSVERCSESDGSSMPLVALASDVNADVDDEDDDDDGGDREAVERHNQQHHHHRASEPLPRKVLMASAWASLGGLLFGYDLGVVSGAQLQLHDDWHLTSVDQVWES